MSDRDDNQNAPEESSDKILPRRLSRGEMVKRTEAIKALGITPVRWAELVATGMKVIRLDPGARAKQHVETNELFKAMDRLSAAYDVLRYWRDAGMLEDHVRRINEETTKNKG